MGKVSQPTAPRTWKSKRSWLYFVGIALIVVVGVLLAVFLGTDVLGASSDDSDDLMKQESASGTGAGTVGLSHAPPPPAGPQGSPDSDLCGGPGDTWMELGQMPIKLGEVAGGILMLNDTKYMLIVGQSGQDEDPQNVGKTAILNMSSKMWKLGAARGNLGNHHTAEVINNELYVFGGFDDGSEDKVQIASLALIDGEVDVAWRYGAPLPYPSGSPNSALIDGKVYLCGGVGVPVGFNGSLADLETIPSCAVYTPSALGGSWSTDVADMPAGRNHAAATTDGTRMFVFGGRTGGNELGPGYAQTQIYDPASNTWVTRNGTSGPLPLPEGRGGMGKAVFANGKCYVIGGEAFYETDVPDESIGLSTDLVYNRTDVYDIAANSWSEGQAMPFGVHGIQPILDGCHVHIVGGGLKFGYSQGGEHLVYQV